MEAHLQTPEDDPSEWVMLVFSNGIDGVSAAMRFINALEGKLGEELTIEQARVGVNAVNVKKDLLKKFKGDLTPEQFAYRVVDKFSSPRLDTIEDGRKALKRAADRPVKLPNLFDR